MSEDDYDFDPQPEPNSCGGYYCSEEHGHIDCRDMTTKDKRYAALTDTDPMPFGKHKGEPMQDVPASYLAWLWRDGINEYSRPGPLPDDNAHGQPGLAAKIKLANYIWNSKGAIEQEIGETL